MFTVPAAIRRVSGPPPVSAPIFTGPVVIPAQTVDTAFSWDMSQYFSGDPVDSYALTNNGGQAWLSINTSTGELSGQTPATPVSVTGVIVTATNTGGSTPTGAFGFEVEASVVSSDHVMLWETTTDNQSLKYAQTQHPDATFYWGDETSDYITSRFDAAMTHEYATAGPHEVRVDGTMQQVGFNNVTPAELVLEISNWGQTGTDSMYRSWWGCIQMVVTATDTPDLSACDNFLSAFQGCTALTKFPVDGWDTSNVTTMTFMFYQCTNLSMDVSAWNISSLTTATSMFHSTALTTADYDALLIGWAAQAPSINNGVAFNAGTAKYSAGAAADARAVLTDTYLWDIDDGGPV